MLSRLIWVGLFTVKAETNHLGIAGMSFLPIQSTLMAAYAKMGTTKTVQGCAKPVPLDTFAFKGESSRVNFTPIRTKQGRHLV